LIKASQLQTFLKGVPMGASKERPGYIQVFTKSIRTRNGKVIYASSYGLKAFCIWVKPK